MNEFIVIFTKSDKGLSFSDGNKIYFPDRKFNCAEEGLAKVHVTHDKKNYAFVDGCMISTQDVSKELLKDYCRVNFNICNIEILQDFDYHNRFALVCFKDKNFVLLYQSDDKLEVALQGNLAEVIGARLNRFIDNISFIRRTVSASADIQNIILFESAQEMSRDSVFEHLIQTYYANADRHFTVINNKYIVNNYNVTVFINGDFHSFTYDKSLFDNIDITDKYNLSDEKNIKPFMIENNIAYTCFYSSHEITYDVHINAFGQNFTVKCFSSCCFKICNLKIGHLVEAITDSRKEIEESRKRFGKMCHTNVQLQDLQKLSPVNYLFKY